MVTEGISGASPVNQPAEVRRQSFSAAMSEVEGAEIGELMGDTLVSMHFFNSQIFNPISDEESDLRAVG